MTRQEKRECFKNVTINDVISGLKNTKIASKHRQKNAGDSYASRRYANMNSVNQDQIKTNLKRNKAA